MHMPVGCGTKDVFLGGVASLLRLAPYLLSYAISHPIPFTIRPLIIVCLFLPSKSIIHLSALKILTTPQNRIIIHISQKFHLYLLYIDHPPLFDTGVHKDSPSII